VERDKPNKSESVGQTLPQLPCKQKRGHLKQNWIEIERTKMCGRIIIIIIIRIIVKKKRRIAIRHPTAFGVT
jgi:hypothetical protein